MSGRYWEAVDARYAAQAAEAEAFAQLTLDDAVLARDDAMTRASDHADPEWKASAWSFLLGFCQRAETFTTDDLWNDGLPSTRENRALGPLIARAARDGLIAKTGEYRPSTRRHLTPLVVWRSRIYRRERNAS